MNKFDVDSWYAALLTLPDDYDHLYNYVKNKKVRQTYLDSIRIITVDLTTNDAWNEKISSNHQSNNYEKKLTHLNCVDIAFNRYSDQMLVILVSYLELIIQEFLEVFYYNKPDKIKHINGYVDLSALLKTKSKNELLFSLSKVAADSIKGGIVSRLMKIEELCGKKFNNNLKEELKTLVKRRNNIIHRDKTYKTSNVIIGKGADNIVVLLRELGLIMKKNKIPIVNKSGLASKSI